MEIINLKEHIEEIFNIKLINNKKKYENFNFNDKHYILMWLCKYGYLEIIKYLYENKIVNINDFRNYENSTLYYACQNGHLNIIKYLYETVGFNIDDFVILQDACENGHLEIVKYLYKTIGLNIDDFRSFDNYALYYTCKNGHLEIVKYLYEVIGLDINDFKCVIDYSKQNNELGLYLKEHIFTKENEEKYNDKIKIQKEKNKQIFNNIKNKCLETENNQDLICSICYEEMTEDTFHNIDCKNSNEQHYHAFHYDCIKNYINNTDINNNIKCPVCNTDINKDNIELLIHYND